MACVVAAACMLAGCAGPDETGPPSARVTSWVTGGGGGAAIGTLEADSGNVAHALATGNPPSAIRTVCALLTNDAETAIGNLPTPDAQLTQELDSAYQDAAAAGDDCYNGAAGNRTLLDRSAAERDHLTPLLAAAVQRIVSVTGHVPSTTTTAPSGAGGDPFAG